MLKALNADFPRTLALLRQEKGCSQRQAARELGISQALLSHYENGVREPGLSFVVKACDYYGVSADFLLGRTMARDGTIIGAEELYDYSGDRDNRLKGSVLATLYKKLLVNSVGVIFGLLGELGDKSAIRAAGEYCESVLYIMFRSFCRAVPACREDMFSLSAGVFHSGAAQADVVSRRSDFVCALQECREEERAFPDMDNARLETVYPAMYQSLLQTIHTTEERIRACRACCGDERKRAGR